MYEITLGIITILILLNTVVTMNNLKKRFCNSISYIKILKVQKKIDPEEAEKLLKILTW